MPKHVLLGSRPFVIRDPARPPGFDPNADERERPPVHEEQPTAPPKAPQPAPAQRVVVKRITVIVVNFKTAHLTQQAVSSLLRHYEVDVLLVDNGSHDASTKTVRELGRDRKHVEAILNAENKGHGPALHQAVKRVGTPYFFTLDSDCEVLRTGFFEKMLEAMDANDSLYAIGWRRWVDRRTGMPLEWHLKHPPKRRFVAYVHPAAALYRTAYYRQLKPFEHHGAPALANMRDAEAHGFVVQSFKIFEYIRHLEAGTRRMYGGRWDPKPTEAPKPWKKNERYPI